MSYSSSFPAVRPTTFDFANSGKLDSRISYSRASTGTAFSNEKHLSSENFLKYSNDLSDADWNKARVTVASTNNTAPDGSSTASSILETADTGISHTFYDQYTSVAGVSYTHTVFAKANGRTKFRLYTRDTNATFDLTAVTATTTGADAVSITAIGSTGWYKCVATEAATNALGILQIELMDGSSTSYDGDVTKGMYFWGMQASSTGETVLNATSGSVHRSFAPTLKSYSSDQPRFEYDATDGQSVGLLIESQATNLQRYGSDFANWVEPRHTEITSNVGIAPNGLLEADLAVPDSSANYHYVYDTAAVIANATTYTGSVYVKKAGHRYIQITASTTNFGSSQYATFDLDNGSIDANNVTASAESVGNGWWRIQATMTSISAGTGGLAITFANTATGPIFPTISGNDYDGVLLWGWQLETGSSASSLVNSGSLNSTISRASDSCSVDLSETSYRGGPVSIVIETPAGAGEGFIPYLFSLTGGDQNFYAFKNTTAASASDDWRYQVGGTGTTVSGSAGSDTVAIRWNTGDVKAQFSAGVSSTNTGAVETAFTSLKIGSNPANLYQLNGNFKRLSLYSVALSDAELATLVD